MTTRSIVLRFDATCFDCGRSLSAGTTARWFGKGRVSCCGGQPPVLPPVPESVHRIAKPCAQCEAHYGDVVGCDEGKPVNSPHRVGRVASGPIAQNSLAPQWRIDAKPPVPLSSLAPSKPPVVAADPFAHLRQLATDTGIPVEALACGMQPAQLAALAKSHPSLRMLVRLASGARFTVSADQAEHVIRCVEESCVDKVRDVSRAVDQGAK